MAQNDLGENTFAGLLSSKGKAKTPSDLIHTFISSFSCSFIHQKYIEHPVYTRNSSFQWA